MYKSVKKNTSAAVTAVMIVFVISCLFLTFLCFTLLSRTYQNNIAAAVSEFAAITIDADKARSCLNSRNADDDYTLTLRKLSQYQQKNPDSVKRISLISFSNTTASYIYDTGGEKLGTKLEYDEYTNSVKAELINGRNSWNIRQSNGFFVYQPVRTVDDILTGYIVAELELPFKSAYIPIFAGAYLFIMLVGLLLVRVLSDYLEKRIFTPISNFTESVVNFSPDNEEAAAPIILSSNRDDEIIRLGHAIQKMFLDINNSAENLSKAIYDANHDGMTQVLNKRCYNSTEEIFRRCKSICVIYFDVNNLKLMNDTLGHEHGDYVIKRAAEYIKSFMRTNDYCFRMGGDEFLFVMTECTFREIDRIVERLDKDAPYILSRESDSVKCAISYGYAYAKGEYSYDSLLTEAEENMYSKKVQLKELLNMPER